MRKPCSPIRSCRQAVARCLKAVLLPGGAYDEGRGRIIQRRLNRAKPRVDRARRGHLMRATGFCVIHAIAVMGVSWAARGGEPPAAKPPRKPPTCPRTSTAGAPRSRLKNAESTRSTRLTAIATTGRGARKAHPGGRRSPRSRSATRMPSATRGSRSGTCWKAGGSPMSFSWEFIRTCAYS